MADPKELLFLWVQWLYYLGKNKEQRGGSEKRFIKIKKHVYNFALQRKNQEQEQENK